MERQLYRYNREWIYHAANIVQQNLRDFRKSQTNKGKKEKCGFLATAAPTVSNPCLKSIPPQHGHGCKCMCEGGWKKDLCVLPCNAFIEQKYFLSLFFYYFSFYLFIFRTQVKPFRWWSRAASASSVTMVRKFSSEVIGLASALWCTDWLWGFLLVKCDWLWVELKISSELLIFKQQKQTKCIW